MNEKLLQGILILIVAIAVLEYLSPAVMAIDVSTITVEWEVKAVYMLQSFFQNSPIALVAGFAWALFGFLRYKFGDASVKFEIQKLYSTWMWFEGAIIIFAAAFPTNLSLGITAILMAVKSVVNSFLQANVIETPTVTPAPTPTPTP